jgi:hypothetical protein
LISCAPTDFFFCDLTTAYTGMMTIDDKMAQKAMDGPTPYGVIGRRVIMTNPAAITKILTLAILPLIVPGKGH